MFRRHFFLLITVTLLFSFPRASECFGPSVVIEEGIVKWQLSAIVHEETDLTKECSGAGEPNRNLTSFLPGAIAIWQGAPETNLSTSLLSIGSGVDDTNFCDFFDTSACPGGGNQSGGGMVGGFNPIVYDEDGKITDLFLGTGARFQTLGFALLTSVIAGTTDAAKGEGVINLTCLESCDTPTEDCVGVFSDGAVLAFVTHELGHFYGLNHTQVIRGEADQTHRPTMNALFDPSIDITSLERDDQVGIAELYPQSPDLLAQDFCTVTGTIRDENDDEFQCANVIVQNTTPGQELIDAISFVSGGDLLGGTPEVGRGRFTIPGLSPGNSYQLKVKPIDISNELSDPGSGIVPCNDGIDQDGNMINPVAPSFDEQIFSEIITCQTGGSGLILNEFPQQLAVQTGDILDVGDIVLTNTSENVANEDGGTDGGDTGGDAAGGCTLMPR